MCDTINLYYFRPAMAPVWMEMAWLEAMARGLHTALLKSDLGKASLKKNPLSCPIQYSWLSAVRAVLQNTRWTQNYTI